MRDLPTDWGQTVAHYGIGKDEPILDIGTGTGRLRLSLVKSGHTNVYGLDSSHDCLRRQAEWQELLGVPVVPGELIHDDDFRTGDHIGRFAAVCMSSALHHIADLRSFLGFVSKVLRPGGHFICTAEPTNISRFNALVGHDSRVDLLEVIELHRTGGNRRTNSTMMFAEFWAGVGFSRDKLAALAKIAGLEIVDWSVWQWLGLLVYNHARNHLPPGFSETDRARFDALYQKVNEIDAELKALMPQFAVNNFFNLAAAFRKE